MYPGLSPDDVVTLYFTKVTNHPDVTNVSALLAFTPRLASSVRATWQLGGDTHFPSAAERLVVTLGGTVNSDIEATLVYTVRLAVLPGGGLRDVGAVSQVADIPSVPLTGSWGDASQPQFLSTLPAIAVDTGGQPGLGPGDTLLLRFNQPVRKVPVGTVDDIARLLVFDPPNWAVDARGAWVDSNVLAVTVVAVGTGAGAPEFRWATRVGALRVSVQPSGNLTSLDGTSDPCNATVVVGHGSWGDPVCDVGLFVFSHTALVVAFSAPVNSSYTPTSYTIRVVPWAPAGSSPGAGGSGNSSDAVVLTVTPSQSVVGMVLPGSTPHAYLRFVIRNLVLGVPYVAFVTPASPELPVDVMMVVPAPVVPSETVSGEGCSCAAVAAGGGCGAMGTFAQAVSVAPQLPEIGAKLCGLTGVL